MATPAVNQSSPFFPNYCARQLAFVLLLTISVTSCAALPFVLPVALEFAKGLFNATAKNYAPGYNEDLMALLTALVRRSESSGGSAVDNPPWPVYGPGPGIAHQTPGGGVSPPASGYPPSFPNTTAPGHPPSGAYPPPPQSGATYPSAPPISGYPPSSGPPYPSSPPAGYPPAAAYPPTNPVVPGTSYPSQAPGASAPVPIALDVSLLRKQIVDGRVVPQPINDGDVLRDGRGDPQAGDKFKIVFRPHTDCFVYIIAIDGSGWAQGLFPSKHSTAMNPVRKGQEYVLPEGPYWYSLDQYRGIETIYFVASYQQRADIEQILTKIAGRERSAAAVPAKVEQPPVLPDGFGGAQPGRPAVVHTETGTAAVPSTTFFAKQAGEDLRITRWFRHE